MGYPDADELGPPNIKLEGLRIWIHGRQFEDHDDYWDGNWLRVTAHCGHGGASVWTSGSIIHLSEIAYLAASSREMQKTLKGEAKLPCIEPNLYVTLKAGSLGHIKMEVRITPDNMSQDHKFIFEIDQSYLGPLITQCDKVLEAYPIRGDRNNQKIKATKSK
jgi:hypothetical protein